MTQTLNTFDICQKLQEDVNSMQITLHNFRTHDHFTCKFSTGGLNLIEGLSGIGKSTIFQAIRWCLYENVRKIYPNNQNSNVKTYVKIELADLIIYRQRSPGLVKVSYGGLTIDNKASAQGIINQIFGQRDCWLATSYTIQDCYSPLIQGNSNLAINILNQLAYAGEEPRQIIQNIHRRQKVKEKDYLQADSAFKRECQLLSQEIQQLGDIPQKSCKVEEIPQLEQLQHDLTGKIKIMEEQCRIENENRGRYNLLQQQLNDTRKLIAGLPSQTDLQDNITKSESHVQVLVLYVEEQNKINLILSNLQTRLQEHMKNQPQLLADFSISNLNLLPLPTIPELQEEPNWIEISDMHVQRYKKEKLVYLDIQEQQNSKLLTLQQQLQSRQEEYKNVQTSQQEAIQSWQQHNEDLKVSTETYNQTLLWENKYKQHRQIAAQLNIAYTQAAIDNKLQQVNQLLPQLKTIDQAYVVWTKINDLQTQLHEWQTRRVGIIEKGVCSYDELNEAIEKYNSYVAARNVHQCPHCQQGIKVVNGQLLADQVIPNLETNISEQANRVIWCRQAYENSQQLENIDAQINKYSTEIASWQTQIANFANINFSTIDQNKLQMQIQELEQSLLQLQQLEIIAEVTPSSQELQEKIQAYQQHQEAKQQIDHNYSSKLSQLNQQIQACNQQINKLKDEIYQHNNKISQNEIDIKNVAERVDRQKENYQRHVLEHDNKVAERSSIQQQNENYIVEERRKHQEQQQLLQQQLTDWQTESDKLRQDIAEQNVALQKLEQQYQVKYENTTLNQDKGQLLQEKRLQLEQYRRQLNYLQDLQTRADNLNQVMHEINLDDNIIANTAEQKSQLLHVNNLLDWTKQTNKVVEWRNRLQVEQVNINTEYQYIMNIAELYKNALEVECTLLEETMYGINILLEAICERLFDKPIQVRLSLYKELKSKKTTQHAFNLVVTNNEIKYDSFNDLSGGEKNRVSLALTIALSRYSHSPILLLDEALNGLGEIKGDVMKIIKDIVPDYKIICIIDQQPLKSHVHNVLNMDDNGIVHG